MDRQLGLVASLLLGAIAPALALSMSVSSCSLSGIASGGSGPTSSSSSAGANGGGSSSSSSSTSSVSSSSAGGGGGGGGAAPTCPDEMVQVGKASSAFCIDRLETTNADYLNYLAGAGPISPLDPLCGWVDTLDPAVAPDAAPASHPVLGVDWCQALAYCESRGKRLCGRSGGGPLPPVKAGYGDDEWQIACSNEGKRAYPWGAQEDLGRCNDCDPAGGCDASVKRGTDAAADVGSFPDCEGSRPGLFDMSGNAWEWQDSCEYDAGARDASLDKCYRRGGGYDVPYVTDGGSKLAENCLACRPCNDGKAPRRAKNSDTGIRCCRDLPP